MRRQFAYDETQNPPAPILPLGVADPRGEGTVLLPALVDTGADCTLIPPGIARTLRLPVVGRVEITGVGGACARAWVHAAFVEIAGLGVLTRVVAFENEAILGRDLLNRIVALLDGPQRRLSLPPSRRRATRSGRRIR